MPTGTVRYYNAIFGFVEPDKPGRDLYLHKSEIPDPKDRELAYGSRVVFEIVEGDRGPLAVNVRTPPSGGRKPR